MTPKDLVLYGDAYRLGILSVCYFNSLTESTIMRGLVPRSGWENPNQDFDFQAVYLEIGLFSTKLMDRSSVRNFSSAMISRARHIQQVPEEWLSQT